MTEDKMVGWHHQLNGHESEQAPGDSEGQASWRAAVHGVAKSWTRLNNNSFGAQLGTLHRLVLFALGLLRDPGTSEKHQQKVRILTTSVSWICA